MTPATKRSLRVAILFLVPLALFGGLRERQSWRPRVLGKMKYGVNALAWSPDGRWLASGSDNPAQWESPGEICVWAVWHKKLRRAFKIGHVPVRWLRFSSDGNELLVVDTSNVFRRCDWRSGAVFGEPLQLPDDVFALSPDGSTLATANGLNRVSDASLICPMPGSAGQLEATAFSADGRKVVFLKESVTTTGAPVLEIWPVTPEGALAEKASRIALPTDFLASGEANISFSPQADSVFVVSQTETRQYDLKSAQLVNTVACDSEYQPDTFSPDGALLAEASPVDSGAVLHPLTGGTSRFLQQKELSRPGTSLAFSADSRTLSIGDDKGFITLWRVK
jgi:hypothetical protein